MHAFSCYVHTLLVSFSLIGSYRYSAFAAYPRTINQRKGNFLNIILSMMCYK